MKKYLILKNCRNYRIGKITIPRILEERVHNGISPTTEIDISGEDQKLRFFDSETGQIFRQYPLCLGKKETPTKEGTFIVAEKWKNPHYKKDGEYHFGKRNGLGGRLIILADHYTNEKIACSIHGIKNFRQGFHTEGCIRLPYKEMRELFDMCDLGTLVYIHHTRNSGKSF